MNRNFRHFAASLAVVAAAFAAIHSAPAAANEPILLQPSQVKALGIGTAVVGATGVARRGALPAAVRVPNEQMRIVSAPVGGAVEMLAVGPGDVVRRGQVLARLASPQALELQRDALQAGAQASLLDQNLKRDEQLFAEGLIAESRLQATRAAAAQAAALANERRQGLSLAGISPGKLGEGLALLAPIDGVVLEQGVQLGVRVEPAALVYRIARLTPLWLEIQAPLELAATLRNGMKLRVADSPVVGRLIAIGRAVDAASQTVLLRAEVEAGAESLRPGQIVEVEIDADAAGAGTNEAAGAAGPAGTAGAAAKSVRIPAAALSRHQGATMVFVQTASGENGDKGDTFVPRPVRIVSQGGDSVVVDGVAAGERIAVKGVSGLKAMLSGVGQE